MFDTLSVGLKRRHAGMLRLLSRWHPLQGTMSRLTLEMGDGINNGLLNHSTDFDAGGLISSQQTRCELPLW
jgi:hypothetical protein